MVSGRRPSEDQLASNDRGAGDQRGSGERVLGMSVEPASSGGLRIEGGRSGSDASQKGLRSGDVIRKAGARPLLLGALLWITVAAASLGLQALTGTLLAATAEPGARAGKAAQITLNARRPRQ